MIVIISRAAEARSAASAPKSTATGVTSFSSVWIVARCERRWAASVGSPSSSITRRTALWICEAFSRKCGRAFDRPWVSTPARSTAMARLSPSSSAPERAASRAATSGAASVCARSRAR